MDNSSADRALAELLRLLGERGYRFVTPTPATHARVIARPAKARARTIEDVLGWSLPFEPGLLPGHVRDCLSAADMLEEAGGLLRCRVRVSSLRGTLFVHSAYPTDAGDAVFFGPDSYRFADLIAREIGERPARAEARIVDVGTGAGVGGVVAKTLCPAATVLLTDVNPGALRLARLNAHAAGCAVDLAEANGLKGIEGGFDLVLMNPPYIMDQSGRTYRDGGGMHGAELSFQLARAGADRLRPGGRLILYTGSAIVNGRDALRVALEQATAEGRTQLSYRELDPDVFGEELANPAYQDVDRIAVVAAVITRPALA